MSGYPYNSQPYGQPAGGGGWQQNVQPNSYQQHPAQGGYCAQPNQYGQPGPQNYGNAPTGGYQSQPTPHGQQAHQQYSPPTNQYNQTGAHPGQASGEGTGERGLMGALAGGAAGGMLGKKNNHGFLGTVGGAIVGSLLQDATKKKKHGHHHH
ncbi:hypothetical protein PCASD_05871 [Puccinia coronata f. sp. avenae]|uniref:Glycine zipper 2TM domain-containing protein n=1 Tax=Puccinia coronata f. sp. avenae TaxID=200324 RepID=A0A2N5V400_9BASI|nr:hypothetical protein PCASD_05871 [Puccinia coronata f. sp. avenae]